MKSLIIFAALLVGMAACETPAPATGSEATPTMDSPAATTTTTTPMSTDTTTRDTSTMKRDSM